jgi:hypothetical protein
MHRPLIAVMLATCAFVASTVLPAKAECVAGDAIVFGRSAPLEGPASALGRGMRLGVLVRSTAPTERAAFRAGCSN